MVHDYTQELIHLQQLTSHITIGTIFIHLAPFLNYQLLITHYQYGLVLNPEESVSANWETIKQFKIVQLMTVNPGFQGAPFIPSVLRKIEELKNLGYEGKIALDGGINDKTLAPIMENPSKPDILCIGSFFKRKHRGKTSYF